MESFLELFDTTREQQQVMTNAKRKKVRNKYVNESSEYGSNSSGSNNDEQEDRLPPEPEQGNVEYKLKLVNPSNERFEHLVTQMKWRLREGHGEAIYQIGTFLLYFCFFEIDLLFTFYIYLFVCLFM